MNLAEFQRRVDKAWRNDAAEVYYADDESFDLEEVDYWGEDAFVTFWLLVLAARGEL